MDSSLLITPVLLVLVIFVLLILVWAVPVRLWVEAVFAGVKVGIGDLIGMRLRKVSPAGVVRPLIAATKAGLTLTTRQLEAHFLAGGHVDRVVKALISADKANLG
ncbi:MAG TPA: flotillin-like FloA family protein, partial [Longimicrobiales bacterium]